MTSDEIRNHGVKFKDGVDNTYDALFWLKEIALQLALINEKDPPAKLKFVDSFVDNLITDHPSEGTGLVCTKCDKPQAVHTMWQVAK